MSGELITIVNHNLGFLDLLELVLGEKGYRIAIATTADDALNLIRNSQPDLVIVDIWLGTPESGINLLQQLSDDPLTTSIPVIVMILD